MGACGTRGDEGRAPPPEKIAAGSPAAAAPAGDPARLDDDGFADGYLRAKEAFERGEPDMGAHERLLSRAENEARAIPLRVNAAMLLGAILEGSGRRADAIHHYRHATTLEPADAGPAMALALALHAERRPQEAVEIQRKVIGLDPDNLENYLALGEMLLGAGNRPGATEAYAAYEMRRKGLLDGLTLRKDGAYVQDEDQRAGCALALASATDEGTALGLVYALGTDSAPKVREAVARSMGVQRLVAYREPLSRLLERDEDPAVAEAVRWALAEIGRDPVAGNPSRGPARGRERHKPSPGTGDG